MDTDLSTVINLDLYKEILSRHTKCVIISMAPAHTTGNIEKFEIIGTPSDQDSIEKLIEAALQMLKHNET